MVGCEGICGYGKVYQILWILFLFTEGIVYVNQTKPTWQYLRDQNQDLQMGGHWTPPDCIPRHKVAIVIPYRNRESNLLLWLQHMHPFLKKQKIEYTVYVMEQVDNNMNTIM
jgi:hypothetical protein